MNKEKQIEEMAKILCGRKNGCDECMFNKVHCYERNDAEALYNAGYRKSSEVAREITAEIGERFASLLQMLPAEGKLTDAKTFIEAHWEFIAHSIMFKYDAELKKKYTESEKDTNITTNTEET